MKVINTHIKHFKYIRNFFVSGLVLQSLDVIVNLQPWTKINGKTEKFAGK